MFKRIPFALAVLALVAGCSSGVDLDKVPVEDKNGAPLSTGGANAGNAGQSGQPFTVPVYGRLPAGQDIGGGSYIDTLIETVTF